VSFSSQIKDKLCSADFACTACCIAETAGILRFGGVFSPEEIRFVTESFGVASRLHHNIIDEFGITTSFVSNAKTLGLSIENKFDTENIYLRLSSDIAPFECCESAYIRGAFLGSGSVSNPEKGYHLEFSTKNKNEALFLQQLLAKKGFGAKMVHRKSYDIVYLKEYEQIADLLGLMGDSGDAFELFSIQIEKEMRNNVNRRVNCENANADKVARACSKHLYAINKIKAAKMWESLPQTLQEIGNLREQYPEDGLKALGERLTPTIGKSGVNHRLERILEFANNL